MSLKDILFESSSDIKGDIGEVLVADALRSQCNMTVIRNVYLEVDGKKTEIDIIGISPVGIFVVEVKNYKGIISGDLQDTYWNVQYPNGNRYRLYNPVIQNSLHVNAVRNLLNNESENTIHNVVIFCDGANLKGLRSCTNVFLLSDFIKKLRESRGICTDVAGLSDLFRTYADGSYIAKLSHKIELGRF